jgi:hypothetical protein
MTVLLLHCRWCCGGLVILEFLALQQAVHCFNQRTVVCCRLGAVLSLCYFNNHSKSCSINDAACSMPTVSGGSVDTACTATSCLVLQLNGVQHGRLSCCNTVSVITVLHCMPLQLLMILHDTAQYLSADTASTLCAHTGANVLALQLLLL